MINRIRASIDYFLDNLHIKKVQYIINNITISDHKIYIHYSPTYGTLSSAKSEHIEKIYDIFTCFNSIDKYKLDIASAYQEIIQSIIAIDTDDEIKKKLISNTEDIILHKLGE